MKRLIRDSFFSYNKQNQMLQSCQRRLISSFYRYRHRVSLIFIPNDISSLTKTHNGNISLIIEHFGLNISEILITIHAITGCDATSYSFKVGKIKVIRHVLKKQQPSLTNIKLTCQNRAYVLNKKNNNDAKEFIRLALYNEEKRENYTETRIRLNESQETSHLCQFHRIHILLLNSTKESIHLESVEQINHEKYHF